MDTFTLQAETDRATGSAASRRLRRTGKVPAVVYGTGSEPRPLSVDQLELRRILVAGGRNALIDLAYDGAAKLAVVKDLQIHALRHDVVHVDFMLVERSARLTVDVPIELVGEATQALAEGAVVQQILSTLTVEAPVTSIPTSIEADISSVSVDTTLRVADLVLPEGVTTQVDPDSAVASAQVSRATLAEEGEAAEAEGEAAEGEGPSAEAEGGAASGDESGGGDDEG
jgi:large subunit ribosomal protein L25